jgi:hypothetical protein
MSPLWGPLTSWPQKTVGRQQREMLCIKSTWPIGATSVASEILTSTFVLLKPGCAKGEASAYSVFGQL